MNKTLFLWLIAVPVALPAQTAKTKIDIDRTTGEIGPKIYGVFMEPIEFDPKRFGSDDTTIHNTLYGTLYDPASPLADENGFKKNFIEAAKELKITNMRLPGGNHVAGYISIHRYWDFSYDYYVYIGQRAMDLEEKINVTASQIAVVRTMYRLNKPIYLSVDEWAPIGRGFLPILAAAQYLNPFIRHADVVRMANYTLFTSLLGNDKLKGTFKNHCSTHSNYFRTIAFATPLTFV